MSALLEVQTKEILLILFLKHTSLYCILKIRNIYWYIQLKDLLFIYNKAKRILKHKRMNTKLIVNAICEKKTVKKLTWWQWS